jgi:hypothetical protein
MARSNKKWRFFTKKKQPPRLSTATNLPEEGSTPAKPSLNNHAEPSGSSNSGGSWFVRKGGKKQDYNTRKSTQQHNETFETASTMGDKDPADDNAKIQNSQEPNMDLFPYLYESAAIDDVGNTDDTKEREDENTTVKVTNEFVFDNGVSSERVETSFVRLEPDAQGRPTTIAARQYPLMNMMPTLSHIGVRAILASRNQATLSPVRQSLPTKVSEQRSLAL